MLHNDSADGSFSTSLAQRLLAETEQSPWTASRRTYKAPMMKETRCTTWFTETLSSCLHQSATISSLARAGMWQLSQRYTCTCSSTDALTDVHFSCGRQALTGTGRTKTARRYDCALKVLNRTGAARRGKGRPSSFRRGDAPYSLVYLRD